MTPYLDPSVYGFADVVPYSYTKRDSSTRLPTFRGRPRYRLKDAWASYEVDVTLTMDAGTFASWQAFWKDSTNSGADPFAMWLMLSMNDIFYSGEIYTVKAVNQWAGTLVAGNYWSVQMRVELPAGILVIGTLCDVIYAGKITDPADDDIYGGPIENLATDEIAPCERTMISG